MAFQLLLLLQRNSATLLLLLLMLLHVAHSTAEVSEKAANTMGRNGVTVWHGIVLSVVLLLQAPATPANAVEEDDDDSSSEETVEDSSEMGRRRRTVDGSIENASRGFGNVGGEDGGGSPNPRIGIPGLPDPETIIKIAEIVQTVGEKVIPILVEGNPAVGLVAEQLNRNKDFLKNFKKEIDNFAEDLKL